MITILLVHTVADRGDGLQMPLKNKDAFSRGGFYLFIKAIFLGVFKNCDGILVVGSYIFNVGAVKMFSGHTIQRSYPACRFGS